MNEQNQSMFESSQTTATDTPPSQPTRALPPKQPRWMIALIAALVVIVVGSGVVGGVMLFSHNDGQKAANTNTQTTTATTVEIPEIGIKITDPENRGLAIFYDDNGKEQCQTNKNYYANNGCNNYLNSTTGHCQDMNLNDAGICTYYIYDHTTYTPGVNTNINAANAARYFQCDSDLTIYQVSASDNRPSDTDLTATVKVGDKSIALWAHGPTGDTSCDKTTAQSTRDYMKDLVQYVKSNLSAL